MIEDEKVDEDLMEAGKLMSQIRDVGAVSLRVMPRKSCGLLLLIGICQAYCIA